jgi:acetyl esterase/lipase
MSRRLSRRLLLPFAVLLFALATAGCVQFKVPPGDAPLRYRDQVFTAVDEVTNITYGSAVDQTGATVTLKLDTYIPSGDTVTSRPAIVWVHGGSFCCGDKSSPEIVDEARTFAKMGYVNVSINYRLVAGGCSAAGPTASCVTAIVQARQDGQTAVAWLRANAATYGVDPTRIAIAGTSAGAITAMDVSYNNSDPASAVRAGVALSGAKVIGQYDAGDAPTFLMHGSSDVVVPYQWAVNTKNDATAAGLISVLTTWEGAGHVPYGQHRTEIIEQTRNFLWWEMDLEHAAK